MGTGRNMPPRPPPTPAEQAIEAERRQTLEQYHSTTVSPKLQTWYLHEPRDAHIAPRVQDFYTDRRQTRRQRAALLTAKHALPKWHYDSTQPLTPTPHGVSETRRALHTMALATVYDRALALYDVRLAYIHEAGMHRLSLWNEKYQERAKGRGVRDEKLLAACEATLVFLEDDYVKRRAEFVMEMYAVLEGWDMARAGDVLDDMATVYPWLREGFVVMVRELVVDYRGMKKKQPGEGRMGVAGMAVGNLGQAWQNARRDNEL